MEQLTYPLFALTLLASTVVLNWRRQPEREEWRSILRTTLILIGLTAIFDACIVGFGIVTYDASRISGIYLGPIPIEDFSYALAAPYLMWTLTKRFSHAPQH